MRCYLYWWYKDWSGCQQVFIYVEKGHRSLPNQAARLLYHWSLEERFW